MATAAWDPWSKNARSLDPGTLDWLKQNPQGGQFGGFQYAPNGGQTVAGGDGGDGSSSGSASSGWARTILPEGQTEIGARNNWELYGNDGNWSNSYIGGTQSGLDKYGWAIPLAMTGAGLLSGMGAGTGAAAGVGGNLTADLAAAGGAAGGGAAFTPIAGAAELGLGGLSPLTNLSGAGNAVLGGGAATTGGAAAAGGGFWDSAGKWVSNAVSGIDAGDVLKIGGTLAAVNAANNATNGSPTSNDLPTTDFEAIGDRADQNAEEDYEQQLDDGRTDFEGPQGSQRWVQDPTTGRWTLKQTLSDPAANLIGGQVNQITDAQGALKSTVSRVASEIFDNPFSMEGKTQIQVPGNLGVHQSGLRSNLGGMSAPNAPTNRYSLEAGRQTAAPNALIRDWGDTLQGTGDTKGMISRMLALDPNEFNQQMADAVYGSSTRYLDPQLATEMQQMEGRLSEQGFVPGTPAFNQAMDQFRMAKERSYADARDRSIELGYQVGGRNFTNSLDALKAALGAEMGIGDLGLRSDTARSGEALDIADFGRKVADTNFNQNRDIVDFLSGQDDQLFQQGMDSNERGFEIAKALFAQNQGVDDAQRRTVLDSNKNIGDTFDRSVAARDQEFDEEKFRSTNTVDQGLRLASTLYDASNDSVNLPNFPSGSTQTPNINRPNPFTGAELQVEQAINKYNTDVAAGVNKQDAYLVLARVLAGLTG